MKRQRWTAWVNRPVAVAWLVLPCLAWGVGPGRADQNDPRLDALIGALKAAPTAEAARPIEERVWVIWDQSGDKAVDALMAEGIARLNMDDMSSALEVFDRVVTIAPNLAEGWNKRATALYNLRRFDESKNDIAKVLALEPRHFGALSGLGLCNMQLGKEDDALSAFRRAAAVDPYLPGLRVHIEELQKRLVRDSI